MSAGDEVRIRLLGGFALTRAGRPVVLPTRKAMALLAVLASRPGAAFSRERLADLLWARSAGAQARGSLRQALMQLRKPLEEGGAQPVIEASGESLRLVPARIALDVTEFEAALAEGTPEALGRAAALYADEFLAGFVLRETLFEQWRQLEAERLRRLAFAGMERLLRHRVERGETEGASALAERLLACDPASEETYQALIRLHLARGALGSAMREYERCKGALAAHLGVAPSPATEALRDEIRVRPRLAQASHEAGPPLIAVLPFANLSDDPAQGYFAQGVTEDVIRELARFRPLRVMAAQSSFCAADPQASPAQIGARLGARYLLWGSVRRGADSIRIGTELVDASSGYFLWTNRYDIRPGDIVAAQDEIARAVAATLAGRIDDARLREAARKPLADLAAYDCWLAGLARLRRGTAQSLAEARPLFQRALELEPAFARAWSGLSLTYFNEWSCLAWERWARSESMAFEYAQRAALMDESDPITHFILGRILLYRREFDRAERYLARAELLNPNDADILAQLAMSDVFLGEAARGVERARLAMRLNPFHDDWYFAFAAAPHLFAGQIETAIAYALKAPEVATDAHAYIAAAFGHLGEGEAAARHLALFEDAYRRNIGCGREPARGEVVRWLLHVNPFRRDEDRAFFLRGVAAAGLAVPPELARAA